MPNPQQPRVYGSPVGYQAPDPSRQQRKPTPATDAQIKSAYQKYMAQVQQQAHAAFMQQLALHQQRARGSSAMPKAPTKPPALLDRAIEQQSR